METLHSDLLKSIGSGEGNVLYQKLGAAYGRLSHPFHSIIYDMRTVLGSENANVLIFASSYTPQIMGLIAQHPFPSNLTVILPRGEIPVDDAHFKVWTAGKSIRILPLDSSQGDLVCADGYDLIYIDLPLRSPTDIKKLWVRAELLASDRCIVAFDDYNDEVYSPAVKLAVDSIVRWGGSSWAPVGCLPNVLDLSVEDGIVYNKVEEYNSFVLQRKPRTKAQGIAVVVPTYRRRDGSTVKKLTSCLEALSQQTVKSFKVFVVGDAYDDEEELKNAVSGYDNLIEVHNNAEHLRNLGLTSYDAWSCGGTLAIRKGFNMAIEQGFDLICMLDDDDTYRPSHLEEIRNAIVQFPAVNIISTRSTYGERVLPVVSPPLSMNNFLPTPTGQVRSSSAYRSTLYSAINVFWDDYLALVRSGRGIRPQDEMCHEFMRNLVVTSAGAFNSILIPSVTVVKESDGNHPY